MPVTTAPDLEVRVPPAYLWVPPHASTSGGEVADLAREVGMPIDGEQQLVLNGVHAERSDGSPASFESCVICARQNLKTHCLRASALADMVLFERPLSVWTAHRKFAIDEAFREFVALFDSYDFLRRRVHKIVREHEGRAIELTSGVRLIFKLRTPGAGRSLSGDVVTLDEGLYVTAGTIGDLYPTMATRRGAQVRIGSSAGKLESEVLRGLRDRGRAGGDPRLTYIEFGDAEPVSCERENCTHKYGTPGCCADDRDRWQRANPALYRRIPIETMEDFRRSMPSEEFVREELGWWEDPPEGAERKFPVGLWPMLVDDTSAIDGVPGLALDVTPDEARSSIGVGGRRSDGAWHVELVKNAAGTDWLVADVLQVAAAQRIRRVGLDGASPAAAFKDALEAAGLEVVVFSLPQNAAACSQLSNLAKAQLVHHRGEYALQAAVDGAGTRDLGEGRWAWTRRSSSTDISPLVAVTVALSIAAATKPRVDVTRSFW